MSRTIEIKFSINVDDAKEVKNLIDTLFNFLPEGYEQGSPEPETLEKKNPAKKKTPVKKAPEPEPELEEESSEEESSEEESEYTITDVRAKLSEKLNEGNNKTKIKSKLTKLGARNVTSLEASKYNEFVEFLDSL